MQIIDIINQLPHHPTKEYIKRDTKLIDTLLLHHSEDNHGSPQKYADWHVNGHQWPGIAYHYVIMKDGTIYLTNYAHLITFHAGLANRTSLAVCLDGNFDEGEPTLAQLASLKWLYQSVLEGSMAFNFKSIKGHREVPGANKTCPGKNVDMDIIRKELEGK